MKHEPTKLRPTKIPWAEVKKELGYDPRKLRPNKRGTPALVIHDNVNGRTYARRKDGSLDRRYGKAKRKTIKAVRGFNLKAFLIGMVIMWLLAEVASWYLSVRAEQLEVYREHLQSEVEGLSASVAFYDDTGSVFAKELECNAPFNLCDYDWDVKTMLAIAQCESRMNPKAFNPHNFDGSNDTGILQINSVHGYYVDDLLDPEFNISVGYKIYQMQGYDAWVAYGTECFYNEYNK